MFPKDIIDAKQDAVRLTSSKYKALRAFVNNLRIAEVFDIRIDVNNCFMNNWSEFEFERTAANYIHGRFCELDEPWRDSMVRYEKMKPVDIYDMIQAAQTNRKSLATFDNTLEQLMSEYITSADMYCYPNLDDYERANDMCRMTTGEYVAIELELCRSLRPVCRTTFYLDVYVSNGTETRVAKFSEAVAIQMAIDATEDAYADDEYNVMKYEIEHEEEDEYYAADF